MELERLERLATWIILLTFGLAAIGGMVLMLYILIAEKLWTALAVTVFVSVLIIIDQFYPYAD